MTIRKHVALALAFGVAACNPPAGDEGPAQGAADDLTATPTPVLIQNFDGSPLTKQRATTIASLAGFDYLGHDPCPRNSNECAIFYVRARTGQKKLYTYQVSSKSCLTLVEGPLPAPVGGGSAPAGLAPASAAPASPPTQTADNASACFATYTTIFRAKQEGFAVADEYGYYATSCEFGYQVVDGGAWRDVGTIGFSRAALDVPNSGETHCIDSYVVTDGDGQELENYYDDTYAIAGSDGSITDKDRCDATAEGAKARYEEVARLAYAACANLVPNGTFTLDLDIGVGVQYVDNLSICENLLEVGLASAAAVEANTKLQCYQQTGLPEYDAPTPEVLLELAEIPEYIDGNVGFSDCSSALIGTQSTTATSSDRTVVCDIDATYSCSWKPPPGSTTAGCTCDKTGQTSVCNDLDP